MRAACGKTARAVRKGGRRQRPTAAASPDPTVVKRGGGGGGGRGEGGERGKGGKRGRGGGRGEPSAFWGGGGAKGPAHQECRFVQPGPGSWEEARETCQSPKTSRSRFPSCWCGRRSGRSRPTRVPREWTGRPGRVRGRSEEQPLQDLESDELGVLLSAPGQGGRDPEAARRRGPFARCAHGR